MESSNFMIYLIEPYQQQMLSFSYYILQPNYPWNFKFQTSKSRKF